MKRLRNRNVRSKEAKKDKYTRFTCIVMLLIILIIPLPVLAADAEFRMMHGEQDAIVVGTVKEISEEGCLVEKSHVILCKAENTLNRQLPVEEIPDELLIKEIKYRYSFHEKTQPEIGDCIVISVDKEGKNWQLFIRSDGEKVNFAYEGDGILYLDGEVVFDSIEYLEALSMDEMKADESSVGGSSEEQINSITQAESVELKENESVSISIIGGADGPTSIFLAGKLGTGFKITVALAITFIVVLAVVVICKIKKK